MEQEIERNNLQHENQISELKKEITKEMDKRELLKLELEESRQKFEHAKELKENIKNSLFENYMDMVIRHQTEIKRLEASILELNHTVIMKQSELSKYNGYLNRIKSDILRLRDKFDCILETEGVD